MILLNMPLVIVGFFLVLTLAVGIFFSRKKTTFREYAVGHKQFSTATLIATVLATTFGAGGLVRNIESIHALGLYWIVPLSLGCCLCLWVISRLALRMGPFMQHISMAETIGSIYGKYPRVMAAFVSICGCIVIITGQINVMSQSITMCLGASNSFTVTILSTLLLIFYATFGGIRSVAFTDVLQFLTFSIIIPLIGWFMFVTVGKPVSVILAMLQSQPKFQFSTLFHFNTKLLNLLLLLLSFIVSYIDPSLMQRVYMASGPIQGRKVFAYAALFKAIIIFFILLIGLFVFAGAPNLLKVSVWDYVMTHIPPFFKGFLLISLFAMAMSTADSSLNACSVIVSYDILQLIQRKTKISDAYQVKIARGTTIIVGLLAMLLSFRCQDLLKLLYWSFSCFIPIVTAPFILAIYGFRGTSRTALFGMATGTLTILVWNQWIKPLTGIDSGAFIAMLANGLAMILAHYLLKQPKGTGWVKTDSILVQIQQENSRNRAERNEKIKHYWTNKKDTLAKLQPNHTTMVCIGFYTFITTFLTYFIECITNHDYYLILQLFLSACLIGYPCIYALSKKVRAIPKWLISLCWLIWLAVYLPINLIVNSWHLVDPVFTAYLSLAHFFVILWIFPLYLGISVVAVSLLVSIYPIYSGLSLPVLYSLLPLFIVSLLIFTGTICLKVKQSRYIKQNLYLKAQEEMHTSKKLKASLYEATLIPSNGTTTPKGYGFILNQAVHKVEASTSFLDNHTPLYKEDFQSIFNKLYDWIAYFNRKEKSKDHLLLQPTKITFDKLIRKVEIALCQEVADPPRILVEKINNSSGTLATHIVCDVTQIVYLLVQAVLRVGKIENDTLSIVRIQLHPTILHFIQADPINNSYPTFMDFKSTAMVISHTSVDAQKLPQVKNQYDDLMDYIGPKRRQEEPLSIDLQQQTLSSILESHYGYLETSGDVKEKFMLLVLPNNVTQVLGKMTTKLPIDALTSERDITPKEQADSMMALMQFHDYVCKVSLKDAPIDMKTIAGILLLLRKHFGFKRHASGQLLYVRAVGISELVVEWAFHSPKVIYAALLYELVRHTCLPLSYIKQHYNLGVYAFVLNVVGIDKRQDLDHPLLLCVQNRLKQAIKEEHIQLSVLFIKLAERLYDLRHAAGYGHLAEVQNMAQETLAIDVQIANTYLSPEIGVALENAAQQALKICQGQASGKEKDNSS